MIKPTVHLNGTSRESLFEQYAEAAQALRQAIDAHERSAPNARDYYPQGPDVFSKARVEHWERSGKLRSVLQEISDLLESVA